MASNALHNGANLADISKVRIMFAISVVVVHGFLTNFDARSSFKMLGHSSIATTSIYMHASQKNNVSNYIDLTNLDTGVDNTIEYKRVIQIKKEKKKSKRRRNERKSKSTYVAKK